MFCCYEHIWCEEKHFYNLLKVTVAKECNSVFPYGVMVRLGGDQDK
jgi:hypothetical protein